ncbi:MAG: AtpZ/AtpI family protein [Actinomycetes bacterium]
MGQDKSPHPGRHDAAADTGAWDIVAYLLSGMLLWGGAGWLLDRWLDLQVFLPIGLLFGTGLALYLVYVRYGRAPQPTDVQRDGDPNGTSR